MRTGTRSDRINDVWEAGDFTGMFRPAARVTIQRCSLVKYNFAKTDDNNPAQFYQTINFQQPDVPRELPNVKSIHIERATDQDAATATVTFFNTKPLPIGELPENTDDLEGAGWYTFNRGSSPENVRWGYNINQWRNWIREDRILRTYQGYGMDPKLAAPADPNLIQTGTWLIDDVDIDSDGDIVCTCRDFAAFLIDQEVYPPVVPEDEYPLFFEMRHPETEIDPSEMLPFTASGSSNDAWGQNPYGHTDDMAFDASLSTYWLSVGNSKASADYSFEWVEGDADGAHVGEVRFVPWKGNYTCYLSIRVGGVWQGSKTIPYNPNAGPAAPNGANVKYVWQGTCGFEEDVVIKLAGYDNVERVRLTFTDLADSDLGSFQYRAGVRNFDIYTGPQPRNIVVGTISDYTDIVKRFCAMGGFYWPQGPAPLAPSKDAALGENANGRVYGDFETAGTGPKVDIPETVWDKKPLMDGITYVKEILGFIFFVDETGGPVFRSPNLWKIGNYTLDFIGAGTRVRAHVPTVLTVDENDTLKKYKVKLSNRNKRKRIIVGNADGTIHAEVPGDESIPADEYPLGMERSAIWTDQHFADAGEARLMAELIKIRQNFTYRRGQITMPANPNMQPDDQVRVIERMTSEGYLHYVSGINSDYDAREGTYEMQLTTFWLGEAALVPGQWVVDPLTLSLETQEYLKRTAKITT